MGFLFFSYLREKKGGRKDKQKGQQNGETSPTHNPMQPGENGIENPDFKNVCAFTLCIVFSKFDVNS